MNAQQMNYLHLTLILIPECGKWVAQCLEYDIASQGDTPEIAIDQWKETLSGQILLDLEDGKDPLDGIPKTPPEYHKLAEEYEKLWEEKQKYEKKSQFDIPVPNGVPPTVAKSIPTAKLAFA